jgi:hypothetical protein
MNVKDWDTQVELARTAVETAFQVADEMADYIEVLENKIDKAVWVLRSIRDKDGELYKVVAELEGKE